MIRTERLRRLRSHSSVALVIVAAVLLTVASPGLAGAAVPAEPAAPSAPADGWVRLGHLAPDTPAVDIYLAKFGQPGKVAFRDAAYGNVTPYSALAAGTYTVSMRPASAPASSPPALSANLTVKADTSSTLLVFQNGPNGTIRGQLFSDDLSTPPAGTGLVRVVQGAPEPGTMAITTTGGPSLGDSLNYGDAGRYVALPQGHWKVSLRVGQQVTPATVDVHSASVSTVVVIAKPGGGLTLSALRDSTGVAGAPRGAAATGAGGTAAWSFPLLPVAVVALLVGGLSMLIGRGSAVPGASRRDRRARV
jgi:hypothetical protein